MPSTKPTIQALIDGRVILDESETPMFDEMSLGRDIIKTWGEYGSHADVFRSMLKELDSLRKENAAYRTHHLALAEILNMEP